MKLSPPSWLAPVIALTVLCAVGLSIGLLVHYSTPNAPSPVQTYSNYDLSFSLIQSGNFSAVNVTSFASQLQSELILATTASSKQIFVTSLRSGSILSQIVIASAATAAPTSLVLQRLTTSLAQVNATRPFFKQYPLTSNQSIIAQFTTPFTACHASNYSQLCALAISSSSSSSSTGSTAAVPNGCLSNPCQHGGTCNATLVSPYYNCTCAAGFNSTNCTGIINYCDSNPCGMGLNNSQVTSCTSIPGPVANYTCYCGIAPCGNGTFALYVLDEPSFPTVRIDLYNSSGSSQLLLASTTSPYTIEVDRLFLYSFYQASVNVSSRQDPGTTLYTWPISGFIADDTTNFGDTALDAISNVYIFNAATSGPQSIIKIDQTGTASLLCTYTIPAIFAGMTVVGNTLYIVTDPGVNSAIHLYSCSTSALPGTAVTKIFASGPNISSNRNSRITGFQQGNTLYLYTGAANPPVFYLFQLIVQPDINNGTWNYLHPFGGSTQTMKFDKVDQSLYVASGGVVYQVPVPFASPGVQTCCFSTFATVPNLLGAAVVH